MLFTFLFVITSIISTMIGEYFSAHKNGYLPAAIIGAIFGLIVSGAILIITSV